MRIRVYNKDPRAVLKNKNFSRITDRNPRHVTHVSFSVKEFAFNYKFCKKGNHVIFDTAQNIASLSVDGVPLATLDAKDPFAYTMQHGVGKDVDKEASDFISLVIAVNMKDSFLNIYNRLVYSIKKERDAVREAIVLYLFAGTPIPQFTITGKSGKMLEDLKLFFKGRGAKFIKAARLIHRKGMDIDVVCHEQEISSYEMHYLYKLFLKAKEDAKIRRK